MKIKKQNKFDMYLYLYRLVFWQKVKTDRIRSPSLLRVVFGKGQSLPEEATFEIVKTADFLSKHNIVEDF